MNNLTKILKKHSMLAVALSTVIGFSAFKMAEVKSEAKLYPYDQETNRYLDTPLDMEAQDTDWKCVGEEGICAGLFDTPPTEFNQTPISTIEGTHVEL